VVEQDSASDSGGRVLALESVESWTGRIGDPVSVDGVVKRYKRGDVLFGKLRPYLAKVARPQQDGVCVGEFLVLRPTGQRLEAAFAEYLLRSKPIIEAVNASTFGARMPRAEWDSIGSIRVSLPPRHEQGLIVRFLDHANMRIRRAIRAKQNLIALFSEQKQAVIHRAVTRGLDSNVRLKPSGLAWVGDIPDHWRIAMLKGELRNLNARRVPLSSTERGTMANRRYDYYGASGVIDRVDDYLFDDELLLVAEDGANLVLRNLPLAVIARGKFWVNNHAHVLKPRSGSTEYFAGLVEAMDLKPWITGAAQPKLTQERLMAIRVPVPPESEQVEIAAWIKSRTTDSDRGIERARQEIALLREYRARLIADAVTGKVDVRDAAARLPDEVDDPEPLDEVDLEGTDEPELDDLDLVEA
jgi:type I restriction enzyme S subunit